MARKKERLWRKGATYFPCRCCFLGCEPRESPTHMLYPCTNKLRIWAHAHRNDPPGFVFEKETK